MGNKDKKFTYSKIIVLITALIFISCIAFSFYAFLTCNTETVIDVTILATCVTVSGSIFGSNLCWYSKKAAGENNYKLRISLYKESSNVRLDYNEKMMELMQKYSIRECDLEKINNNSDMDEMMDSCLEDTINNLDANRDDCSELNTIENFDNM